MWAGLPVDHYVPPVEIIHILLAVALRPEDCQSRDAQGKLIDFPAHLDDPLQVSATTISQQALVLLRAWLAPDGLAVLQALPGYVEASPFELTGHLNAGDKPPDPDQSRTLGRRIKGRSLRTSGGRRGRLSANGANASDEDVDLDDDSLIRQAAARVAACENIWEVLAGQALKKPYRGDEAHPLAPRGGSLLSVLLDAWELDAQQNKDAGWSPHLLRQFNRKLLRGPRKIMHEGPLDIIFAPYRSHPSTQTNTGLQSESLSARLLRLMGALAEKDKIDRPALIAETLRGMCSLPLLSFIDFLSTQFTNTVFFKELLLQYLTLYSENLDPASKISYARNSLEQKLALRPARAGVVLAEGEEHEVAGAGKHAAVKLAFLQNALSPEDPRCETHRTARDAGTLCEALERSTQTPSAGGGAGAKAPAELQGLCQILLALSKPR